MSNSILITTWYYSFDWSFWDPCCNDVICNWIFLLDFSPFPHHWIAYCRCPSHLLSSHHYPPPCHPRSADLLLFLSTTSSFSPPPPLSRRHLLFIPTSPSCSPLKYQEGKVLRECRTRLEATAHREVITRLEVIRYWEVFLRSSMFYMIVNVSFWGWG